MDIRVQVRSLKSLFPDHINESAQQLQLRIQDTIRTWVNDGSYLHDIIPNSVSTIAVTQDTSSYSL
jgi:hypothetical protein